MGGVALNFSEWANGPGAGKGRDWKKPAGHYAIAQLSPWVLWPPDGLNLKQGTSGELFGYGYLPLPLTAPKKTTAGQGRSDRQPLLDAVPEHRQLQGPVAFFTAVLLVAAVRREPQAGRHVPRHPAVRAEQGVCRWRRSTSPRSGQGREGGHLRPHRPHAIPRETRRATRRWCIASPRTSKAALWDGVQAWFDGGERPSGKIDPKAVRRSHLQGQWRSHLAKSTRPDTARATRRCRWPGVRSPRPPPWTTPPSVTSWAKRWCRQADVEGRVARHPARVLPPGEGQEG